MAIMLDLPECPHNMGGTSCRKTFSAVQDNTCGDYADWEKRKKSAYDIKLAVTIENHSNEIQQRQDENIDIAEVILKISRELQPQLSTKQYVAFRMLFVENHSEETVANYLG